MITNIIHLSTSGDEFHSKGIDLNSTTLWCQRKCQADTKVSLHNPEGNMGVYTKFQVQNFRLAIKVGGWLINSVIHRAKLLAWLKIKKIQSKLSHTTYIVHHFVCMMYGLKTYTRQG